MFITDKAMRMKTVPVTVLMLNICCSRTRCDKQAIGNTIDVIERLSEHI